MEALSLLYRENFDFLKASNFGKVLKQSWSHHQKLTYFKSALKCHNRCLSCFESKFDKNISLVSVPNAIMWFRCKLKPCVKKIEKKENKIKSIEKGKEGRKSWEDTMETPEKKTVEEAIEKQLRDREN